MGRTIAPKPLKAFKDWYEGLTTYASTGGWPALGTIAAALVVLERLKDDFDLNLSAHRATGGSQIKGVSGAAVRHILNAFGEHRRFLSEGGRTNRGAPGDIGSMLEALKTLDLGSLPEEDRRTVLESLQSFLVDRVREWHNRQRLAFVFDASKTTWQIVRELLDKARESGKEGPVAQYLVGAKLQMRYPDIEVENFSFSTSDVQQGRAGDFFIGNTAFHITVSPMLHVYERCRENLEQGCRAYLLVPDRAMIGARQNAEGVEPGRIFVDSIESFVGGNVDEMSQFGRQGMIEQFRKLLETYNQRVDSLETDKSMLIEIPASIR